MLARAVAQPVPAQISMVFDRFGDARFNAPAFQDIVRGRIDAHRIEKKCPSPTHPSALARAVTLICTFP